MGNQANANRKARLFNNKKTQAALEKITAISDTRINSKVQASHAASLNQDIIELIQIDSLHEYSIICCEKTGQRLAMVDDKHLTLLVATQPEQANRIKLLKHATIGRVHPAWLQTDGESLHQLQTHDPVGYCVYTMSLILQPDTYDSAESRWQAMNDKRKAYVSLSGQSFHSIIRANEISHRFLNFLTRDDFIRHIHLGINALAEYTESPAKLAEYISAVQTALQKVILRYVDKTRTDTYNAIQSALKEAQTNRAGLSNLRNQAQVSNKKSRFDQLLDGMADIFDNLSADSDGIVIRKSTSSLIKTDDDRELEALAIKTKTQKLRQQAIKLQSRPETSATVNGVSITSKQTFNFAKKS